MRKKPRNQLRISKEWEQSYLEILIAYAMLSTSSNHRAKIKRTTKMWKNFLFLFYPRRYSSKSNTQ